MAGRTLNVSVVLVHYHTPALAEEAVAALHRDAASAGLALECLLVDNGSTEAERAQLKTLPCHHLLATDGDGQAANLGYAGGVNQGVAQSTGDVVVVMNPDVFVQAGCLSALCAALDDGVDVAGPRFFLDRGCRLLQPPADLRTRRNDLRTVLAQAGWRSASTRRLWRRHAHRFWCASDILPCAQLSGAMLAFRRSLWDQVGPFDPDYPLYFEETDWLARVRRAGGQSALVPAARAVHLYAQSTLAEPRSNTWFGASEARFRRQWYGAAHTAVIERLGRRLEARRARWQASDAHQPLPAADSLSGAAWLELSIDRSGVPAAGIKLDPEGPSIETGALDAMATWPAARYMLRWVDQKGRDVAARPWTPQNRSESPIV